MKSKLYELFFGRDSLVSGIIAVGIVSTVALGCTCGKNIDFANIAKNANIQIGSNSSANDDDSTASEMPDDRLLKALVKETTAEFAQAISTEDFANIYDKSSSDFKNTYTEEEMKATFKSFIEKKKVVLPILAKAVGTDPEFSPVPYIRTENGLSILVVSGKYSTKPVPVNFEYEYVKRDDKWKLLKLVIRLI